SGATVSLNQFYNNFTYGIYAAANSALISNNQAFANRYGIYATNNSSAATDLVRIDSNTVHSNIYYGIVANASYTPNMLVQNNVVCGQTSPSSSYAGISLSTAEATGNIVFDNSNGIITSGNALIHDNRVYHNTLDGILVDNATQAYNNRIYNNARGIETGYYFAGQVRNNLIYANSAYGVLDQSGYGQPHFVTNNTVYQPAGTAVRLQNSTKNLRLANNIFSVQSGYAVSVNPDSEIGFSSDYNLYYLTGGAKLGQWENRDFAGRVDWFYELGFDAHSLTGDPMFANPAGADGILGYSSLTTG